MRWDSNVKKLAQSPRLDVVDQSSRKLPSGKFTGCFIHANMNANFRIPGIMPKPGIIRIHAIQCKRNVPDAFEKWKKCSKVRKCTSASETLCSAKSLMNEHATRVFFSRVEYDAVYRIWDEHFDPAVRFVEQCHRFFSTRPNVSWYQRLRLADRTLSGAHGFVPTAACRWNGSTAYSDRVSVQLGQCAFENRQRLRSSATALGKRRKKVCMKMNNVYASA